MKAKLPKQDQIDFITNKVTELGSVEAVERLYSQDCVVDVYARKLAGKLFSKPLLNRRKGR
jgi:16S rRNA U1498 N3-methylase RsmE